MADTKISALTELTVPPDPTDELVVVDKSDTTMAATGTDKRIQFSNLFDWAESGDLSTIEPDDAAAAGTSTEFARADHQHQIVGAVAAAIQPDDAATEGVATSFARSDHKHAIDAATAITLTGTNAEGTSTSFARADHNHSMPNYGVGFVTPPCVTAIAGVATGATNQYYAAPVLVLAGVTLSGIRYRVGATSNGNVRSALYDAAGTKVADKTSDVAQAVANAQQAVTFTATYAAAPGLYYALIWFSSATATYVGGRQLGSVATGTQATTVPASITPGQAAVDIPVMVTL